MTINNAMQTNSNILTPEVLQAITFAVNAGMQGSKEPERAYKGDSMTLNTFFYGDFQLTQVHNTDSQKNTLKAWYRPHIQPLLGNRLLSDITYEDLQGLFTTLGLSYNTLKSYKGMIRHIFSYALKREYIRKDPSIDLKIPREKLKAHQNKLPATIEHYKALYEVSKNDWCGIIIPLLFETGMRREEILALEWTDVKDTYIDVNKAYASTKGGNSHAELKEPKTKGSYRHIPITPALRKALKRHKSMQNGHKDFVVSQQRENKRLSPTGFNRKWTVFKQKAGIWDKITPHSCRHYFASLMLTMGIPVNEAMRITGHDNIKTFMKYAYVNKPSENSTSKFLNAIKDFSPIEAK